MEANSGHKWVETQQKTYRVKKMNFIFYNSASKLSDLFAKNLGDVHLIPLANIFPIATKC